MKLTDIITCKLRGTIGKGAKSHILPQALTTPGKRGDTLFQLSAVRPQKNERRLTSWYDRTIVTQEGESILSKIDNDAIDTLRKHSLIWRHQSPETRELYKPVGNSSEFFLREIDDISHNENIGLWLFYASILWRCAASSLPEFQGVKFKGKKFEILTDIINGKREPNPNWLPITLLQLLHQQDSHNHSPYISTKKTPKGIHPKKRTRFLRVFLDGIVSHIELDSDYAGKATNNSIYLSRSSKLTIPGRLFEGSREKENLLNQMTEFDRRSGKSTE